MAGQGSVVTWVAIHRRHHECSDASGDPHSPQTPSRFIRDRALAFWHGHLGWVINHPLPNPKHYARDILKDSDLIWISRTYYVWVLLGIALPGCAALAFEPTSSAFVMGCIWGGWTRVFLVNQVIWSINSVCHAFGKQDHETKDDSRNNFWLAVPSFGEAWHNNHHAHPSAARFGGRWWEIDTGYWMICALQRLGLAWGVKLNLADGTEHSG